MKILLTGACGYVGSRLLVRLRELGHNVMALDTTWFRKDPSVHVTDVRRVFRYESSIATAQFDCIIHLAAIANDPSVDFYPKRSWETSVLATQQLAQWAQRQGSRFIYASSVSVYGADRGKVTEDMAVYPISDYNKTKMCAERVLLSYPDIKPQIIRPATICGLSPRMRLDLTVNLFTVQALSKGKITVHGGEQWRPSIHIDDMVDLYVWMLEHPEHVGLWNAGFENHRLIDIAKTIAEECGASVEITAQRDVRSYQVNSDKLLKAGFRPRKTILDAVREIKEAWRSGALKDEPQHYNLGWMRRLEIKDE